MIATILLRTYLLLALTSLFLGCASSAGVTPTRTTISTAASARPTAASPSTAAPAGDPAKGQHVFASQPCSSCHDISRPYPGGAICPNLGNVAEEAARIVKSAEYHGKAHDAAGYIRESIVDPNAYIVPDPRYRQSEGQSVMPKNFAQVLTAGQIDDLVAFLMAQTNGQLPQKP